MTDRMNQPETKSDLKSVFKSERRQRRMAEARQKFVDYEAEYERIRRKLAATEARLKEISPELSKKPKVLYTPFVSRESHSKRQEPSAIVTRSAEGPRSSKREAKLPSTSACLPKKVKNDTTISNVVRNDPVSKQVQDKAVHSSPKSNAPAINPHLDKQKPEKAMKSDAVSNVLTKTPQSSVKGAATSHVLNNVPQTPQSETVNSQKAVDCGVILTTPVNKETTTSVTENQVKSGTILTTAVVPNTSPLSSNSDAMSTASLNAPDNLKTEPESKEAVNCNTVSNEPMSVDVPETVTEKDTISTVLNLSEKPTKCSTEINATMNMPQSSMPIPENNKNSDEINLMADVEPSNTQQTTYKPESPEQAQSGKSTPIIPHITQTSTLVPESFVTNGEVSSSYTSILQITDIPEKYINGGTKSSNTLVNVSHVSRSLPENANYSSVSASSVESSPVPNTVLTQDQDRAKFPVNILSAGITTTPRRIHTKNPNLLLENTLRKVRDLPNITDHGRGLTRLSAIIKKYVKPLQNTQASGFINNPQLANEVLRKLTLFQRVEYGKFAYNLHRKRGIDLRVNPNLEYVSEFLDYLLRITQYFCHVASITDAGT